MNEVCDFLQNEIKDKSNCLIDKTTKFLEEYKELNFVNVNLQHFPRYDNKSTKRLL